MQVANVIWYDSFACSLLLCLSYFCAVQMTPLVLPGQNTQFISCLGRELRIELALPCSSDLEWNKLFNYPIAHRLSTLRRVIGHSALEPPT